MKGNASDILRRLGTGVGIREVIDKLESTFGSIESEQIVLRKFYACTQEPTETVINYASRLEEISARAIALGTMKKDNDRILKKVFYQGLLLNIKQLAFNKCDSIDDYDRFKIEVRKIEADLATQQGAKPKCQAAVNVDRKEKSEMTEVRDLFREIKIRGLISWNNRRRRERTNQFDSDNYYRGGRGQYRQSYRGRGMPQDRGDRFSRGRRGYRPMRQTGTNTHAAHML